MAETSFGQTSHRGIARAEVRVAATDLDGPVRTVRNDPSTYAPLVAPGAREHGWSPPTPAALTEAELRAKLADALDAQEQAEDRMQLAQSASDRAQLHLKACDATLHAYDGLEDAISASVIEQLTDGGRAVEIGAELDERVGQRERARMGYAAATRAAEQLTRDLSEARGKAAEAATLTDRLICSILGFAAAGLAEHHAALLAEAALIAETLHAFNLFSANRGASLPASRATNPRQRCLNPGAPRGIRRRGSKQRQSCARTQPQPSRCSDVGRRARHQRIRQGLSLRPTNIPLPSDPVSVTASESMMASGWCGCQSTVLSL